MAGPVTGPSPTPIPVLPPVVVPPPDHLPVGLTYQDQESSWVNGCPGCAARDPSGACASSRLDLFHARLFFAQDADGLPWIVTKGPEGFQLALDPWYCDPVWQPQLAGQRRLRLGFNLPEGWRADGVNIVTAPDFVPPVPVGGLPSGVTNPGIPSGTTPGGQPVTWKDVLGKAVSIAEAAGLLKQLGGKEDFAGVVAALIGVVTGEGEIGRRLESLAPGFADALVPHFIGLTAAITDAQHALARSTEHAAEATGQAISDGVTSLGPGLLAGVVDAAKGVFRAIVQLLKELLADADALTTAASQTLVEGMLRVFEETLVREMPVTPANVHAVAGAAIRDALAAGLTAHLAALGIELLHPAKHMGLPEMAALIAEFAGFKEIIGPTTTPTLRYALQLPGTHRAANLFRTELPDSFDAKLQAARGAIAFSDYAQVLAMRGYPPEWVQVLVGDTYLHPPIRAIAQLVEGSEADPAWIAQKFRDLGLSPTDIRMGVAAVAMKTTMPGRQQLTTKATAEYVGGRLTREDYSASLTAAGLPAMHREYWLRAADLQRRGDTMEKAGAAIVKQYTARLLDRGEAAAQLAGVGFVAEEVTARLLEADYALRLQQTKAVTKDQLAEVTHIRTSTLASLKAQLKARQLDRTTFQLWGEALGYAPAYVAVVADTVLLGPAAAHADQLPIVGLGAVEAAAAAVAPTLMAGVTAGRIPAAWAVAELHQLGLPADLAKTIIDLAEVLGLHLTSPLHLVLPLEGAGRLTWEGLAAAAVQLVHRGQGGTRFLEDALTALGVDSAWAGDTTSILSTLERLFIKRRP